MVTTLGKLCGRLAGAARKHVDRIVDSLTERWRDRLADGEELTVRKMLTLLAEDLDGTRGQLSATENQLRSEIREDKQERDVRDRSNSDLRELLFDVKKVCDAHHGPGSVEILFEENSEDVPTEPSEVFRLAARVRRNMTDPEFALPPLKHGVAPDFAALAIRFDAPLADLEASLRSLDQGIHGSSGVVADKERDFSELGGFAGRAGRFIESITSLSGHPGVASRIRLSRHRARAGVEDVDDVDEPDADGAETEAAETGDVDAARPDIPPETEAAA
jgi:hypothetical protein